MRRSCFGRQLTRAAITGYADRNRAIDAVLKQDVTNRTIRDLLQQNPRVIRFILLAFWAETLQVECPLAASSYAVRLPTTARGDLASETPRLSVTTTGANVDGRWFGGGRSKTRLDWDVAQLRTPALRNALFDLSLSSKPPSIAFDHDLTFEVVSPILEAFDETAAVRLIASSAERPVSLPVRLLRHWSELTKSDALGIVVEISRTRLRAWSWDRRLGSREDALLDTVRSNTPRQLTAALDHVRARFLRGRDNGAVVLVASSTLTVQDIVSAIDAVRAAGSFHVYLAAAPLVVADEDLDATELDSGR